MRYCPGSRLEELEIRFIEFVINALELHVRSSRRLTARG
jgi:hypothetical protein